jgi:hypothetical protein
MTFSLRAFVVALFFVAAIRTGALHADTVQLTLRDGRLSLVANNATPAQIFEAWSRAGGVLVVNADRVPSVPITLTLENVPEEQALDTLLRPVSGYLARRRPDPAGVQSVFDRIVILATPQVARQTTPAPAPPQGRGGTTPVFPQPTPANGQQMPQGIPQGPGVTRLTGADGQPLEDDQAGAPPPYNGGDAPPPQAPRPVPFPRPPQPPPQQQPQQPQPAQPPSSSSPSGVPVPGMPVPQQPQSPGQAPTPGQTPGSGPPSSPGQAPTPGH